MKKIYRVSAHNPENNMQYVTQFYLADNIAQLAIDLYKDHMGTIDIDEIEEVTLQQVINITNLHME